MICFWKQFQIWRDEFFRKQFSCGGEIDFFPKNIFRCGEIEWSRKLFPDVERSWFFFSKPIFRSREIECVKEAFPRCGDIEHFRKTGSRCEETEDFEKTFSGEDSRTPDPFNLSEFRLHSKHRVKIPETRWVQWTQSQASGFNTHNASYLWLTKTHTVSIQI